MGDFNKKRAEWAAMAVKRFSEVTGSEPPYEAIKDLLCDLRHLCDREDVDWSDVLFGANEHYYQEIIEDD